MRALPCAQCGRAAGNSVEPPSISPPTLVSPSVRFGGKRLSYRAERQLQAALDGRRCRGQNATSAMPAATLVEVADDTGANTNQKFLPPITKIEGYVQLPGSKSLSNRILLLAALSKGLTAIDNVLDSEDTQHMVAALRQLGVEITTDWPQRVVIVHGCGGRFPAEGGELYLGNAGTAMRPLTAAVAAAGRGKFVLDGVKRMRERPIQDLVDGLTALGVDVKCTLGTGCPPVEVNASGLPTGKITLNGSVSSQYLTAILMAAPLAQGEGAIEIECKDLISQPYVEMTIKLMERFNVKVERLNGLQHLRIPAGQMYKSPGTAYVEGDASSASYWLAGATITGGKMTVEGCGSDSLQGDVRFAEVMEQMGAKVKWEPNKIIITGPEPEQLKGGTFDCIDIPDAAMTLAVVAAFADSEVRISNVESWRYKETERMKAIVTELGKLGINTKEGKDYLIVYPSREANDSRPPADPPGVEEGPRGSLLLNGEPFERSRFRSATIDTYDDHRMAMAFALAACSGHPITINDPGCVRKTYPYYFKVLQGVGRFSDAAEEEHFDIS